MQRSLKKLYRSLSGLWESGAVVIDLTVPVDRFDVDALLSEWRWLVPNSMRPVQMSKFGDWFLLDSGGAVFHLSLLDGKLEKVAASLPEYNRLKDTPEKQTDWFLDGFVFRCHHEGLDLKEGECYGWRVHPIMDGKFEYGNIEVFSLAVYQSLMGQIFRQWGELKPGDPIPQLKIIEKPQ